LGRIAIKIADAINTQHQAGVDINGVAGGMFFNDVMNSSPSVLASNTNDAASGTVAISITDASALEVSDYQLNYDGSNFSLLRLSDNSVVDSGFTVADLPRGVAGEGFSISLTGTVAAGDRFKIQPTKNAAGQITMQLSDPANFAAAASGTAAGNNDNALLLADLQNKLTIANGTETFQGAFGSLVADVSIKTNQESSTRAAQGVLLEQARAAHSSVSGVNLDEEAANMLRYQQAYQASARVIAMTDEIFRSLISAIG
ncbi:MAG: flagellar basal body rod C-terminal domain-containing protein, partial [Thiohalomonadales bacterium]